MRESAICGYLEEDGSRVREQQVQRPRVGSVPVPLQGVPVTRVLCWQGDKVTAKEIRERRERDQSSRGTSLPEHFDGFLNFHKLYRP